MYGEDIYYQELAHVIMETQAGHGVVLVQGRRSKSQAEQWCGSGPRPGAGAPGQACVQCESEGRARTMPPSGVRQPGELTLTQGKARFLVLFRTSASWTRPTHRSRVLVGARITFQKPFVGRSARSLKGNVFLAKAASVPRLV